MITMAAGLPPVTQHKLVIVLSDGPPTLAATLHLPADTPPPTRAEYADALRQFARNLAATPEGTEVPAAAVIVQRP